jgi:hypothetical protein
MRPKDREIGGCLRPTQYFHRACRLHRAQSNLGEFLAESLLNEAKILEVLFPAPPREDEKACSGWPEILGFNEEEIEALYIPALELRGAIDVAHPALAVFSTDDTWPDFLPYI